MLRARIAERVRLLRPRSAITKSLVGLFLRMRRIATIWHSVKLWRKVRLGPVSLIFRMGRTVRVSSNTRRRLVAALSRRFHLHNISITPQTSPSTSIAKSSSHDNMHTSQQTALVVGVGPGLGFAVARTLAARGMRVALA